MICNRLTEGQSLRAVCADTGLAISTVLLWCKSHPEFAAQYARATEIRAHRMVDEMREIAAGVCDQASAARARLEIDVIKWQASKMLPKVYGDKIEVSGNAESPLSVVTRIELVALGDGKRKD